jgi:hypothetical protein
MTARVTQQILLTAYRVNAEARVTSVALEVLRPNTSLAANNSGIQVIVVAS